MSKYANLHTGGTAPTPHWGACQTQPTTMQTKKIIHPRVRTSIPRTSPLIIAIAGFALSAASTFAQTPGIQGFGAGATGGSNAERYYYINGQQDIDILRTVLRGTTRTYVDVAGVIDLTREKDGVTLESGTQSLIIDSNKTLRGRPGSRITGSSIFLGNSNVSAQNVVLRELYISNPNGDGITIQYGQNVAIYKCTFYHCRDGSVDVTRRGDNVSISYCKFDYGADAPHAAVNLIAGDTGTRRRVTIHHSHYTGNCDQRMPRVSWAFVHAFSNYIGLDGSSAYGVSSSTTGGYFYGTSLVFEKMHNPWLDPSVNSDGTGTMRIATRLVTNCTWGSPMIRYANEHGGHHGAIDPLSQFPFDVTPYAFSETPTNSVKSHVMTYAGR